jgi:adenylate cyclase
MIDYQLFEQVILNLLKVSGIVPDYTDDAIRKLADFVIRQNNKKVLIEVKTTNVTSETCKVLASKIQSAKNKSFARFILVTPTPPTAKQLEYFSKAFKDVTFSKDWMSAQEFAKFLGIKEEIDVASPKTLSMLQAAATTKGFQQYSLEFVSASPQTKSIEEAQQKLAKSPTGYVDLTRQFSFPTLKLLETQGKPLTEILAFGNRYPEAIVVLSDIKNFSSFVKAAQPDVLNECMAKYYRHARELVWKHEGVLDKFIGDAVLAIFNFPLTTPKAPQNALEFCIELIELGQDVATELKSSINEIIESGTRVGVSHGPLWPLNIGSEHIEISFVGDVINLAARLEKECVVNGILIENRTNTALTKTAPDFQSGLKLQSRVLTRDQVKGQLMDIQSWQVPPEVVQEFFGRKK